MTKPDISREVVMALIRQCRRGYNTTNSKSAQNALLDASEYLRAIRDELDLVMAERDEWLKKADDLQENSPAERIRSFKAGMVAGLRAAACALHEAGFAWDDEAIAIVIDKIEHVDAQVEAMRQTPDGDLSL